MSGKKKITSSNVVLVIGIFLVVVSLATLLVLEFGKGNSASEAQKTASALKELMPPVYDTAPDDRGNTAMAAIELHGRNYCGIIEVPMYGCTLPIESSWSRLNVSKNPCKYMGNIYEGNLIIGGSDAKGQFDFHKSISNGDLVYITDMTGGRYRYTVTEIVKTRDVSTENLSAGEHDLVLFARNSTGFDYTVIRCTFSFGTME